MAFWLERRADGSCALLIDGDLQFDSRDERLYHEALVLPGLALVEARTDGPLDVLICGGGDGLAAREALKSARVRRLDLVDYDAELVAFARSDLAALNRGSLDDARVDVTLADAWEFVETAEAGSRRYDLVVCDLTVPTAATGTRLQGAGWYRMLARILRPGGVLVANAVSPAGAPRAFAAICNGVRAAGLAVSPLRVPLASFRDAGYGPDWGFVLASAVAVSPAEFAGATLAEPRAVLRDGGSAARMFRFPESLAALVAATPACSEGGEELLAYLAEGAPEAEVERGGWDALARPLLPAAPSVPPGPALVRPAALSALERGLSLEEALAQAVASQPAGRARMLEAFFVEPLRFLDGLDLRTLVARLLTRAASLPEAVVRELRALRRKLARGLPDQEALLRVGPRVLAVIALAVIIANLALPDTVYGKGAAAGEAAGASVSALAHPAVSGKGGIAEPEVASSSGFRSGFASGATTIDETGTTYPARTYWYYPSFYRGSGGYSHYSSGAQPTEKPKTLPGIYRLTSDTDILSDGQVAVSVGDTAYLVLGPEVTLLTDRATGTPLLYVAVNPQQLWRAAKELDRQATGLDLTVRAKQRWIDWFDWLDFLPGASGDRAELKNIRDMRDRLRAARATLGPIPATEPAAATPPAPGAIELFSGVWLPQDGSGLIVVLPDGLGYMQRTAWFRDPAFKVPLDAPFPPAFRTFAVAYLNQQVSDEAATRTRLANEVTLTQATIAQLQLDLSDYDSPGADPTEKVAYGSSQVARSEAIRLTKEALALNQQIVVATNQEIAALPAELTAARAAIKVLGP